MSDERPFSLATCSWFEFHPDMGMPVRISLGVPRWKNAATADSYVTELTPRPSYFKDPLPQFTARYIEQLERFGVEHLTQRFTELSDFASGTGLVLLCFERLAKPGTTGCHRRTFARWWEEKTGQEVPELGSQPQPPTAPKPEPEGLPGL